MELENIDDFRKELFTRLCKEYDSDRNLLLKYYFDAILNRFYDEILLLETKIDLSDYFIEMSPDDVRKLKTMLELKGFHFISKYVVDLMR